MARGTAWGGDRDSARERRGPSRDARTGAGRPDGVVAPLRPPAACQSLRRGGSRAGLPRAGAVARSSLAARQQSPRLAFHHPAQHPRQQPARPGSAGGRGGGRRGGRGAARPGGAARAARSRTRFGRGAARTAPGAAARRPPGVELCRGGAGPGRAGRHRHVAAGARPLCAAPALPAVRPRSGWRERCRERSTPRRRGEKPRSARRERRRRASPRTAA